MFFSHILKSLKDRTYYYGSAGDLDKRNKTHNSGKVSYTRGHLPYKLHYYETLKTRKEAIGRE